MKKVLILAILLITCNLYSYDKFIDPNPGERNSFGTQICTLPSGNVVVTAPYYLKDSLTKGAVYLFNGANGELISSLYGTNGAKVTVLNNGNFLVASPFCNIDTIKEAGAVTIIDGYIGLNGKVNENNSIVGMRKGDHIGEVIQVLANNNILVHSPFYKNKNYDSIGAITFININKPITGYVNESNSLIGNPNYAVLNKKYSLFYQADIDTLSNGSYLVRGILPFKTKYSDSIVVFVWGSPDSGICGEINENNSFSTFDRSTQTWTEPGVGICKIGNSNYLIVNTQWKSEDGKNKGLITWCDGSKPLIGKGDITNSFYGVGDSPYIRILPNGNYLIINRESTYNGRNYLAFGDCNKGLSGLISQKNALYCGPKDLFYDDYGSQYILPNGCLVCESRIFNEKTNKYVKVLTKLDGKTGLIGKIDTTNSFYTLDDSYIHFKILKNGDFIIINNSSLTYCYSNIDLKGRVSKLNSIVERFPGELHDDSYSQFDCFQLSNGELIVYSQKLNSGLGIFAKYKDASSLIGELETMNCLKGSKKTSSDYAWVNLLNNGNYLICSNSYLLWKNKDEPLIGTINEKIYSNPNGNILTLNNGNYLILNPFYKNNAGAVTFCDGTKPAPEEVNLTNSLIGRSSGDLIGAQIFPADRNHPELVISIVEGLENSNYVVPSPYWQNDDKYTVGAITIGSGTSGITGIVNSETSLIGSGYYPKILKLKTGNLLVSSGSSTTWINPSNPITGEVNNKNSLIQFNEYGHLEASGYPNQIYELANGNFILRFDSYKKNNSIFDFPLGCFSFGDNTKGITGYLSEYNSILAPDRTFYDYSVKNNLILDTINKLIYISFPSDDFVRVIPFDNKLEVRETNLPKDLKVYPNPCINSFKFEINLSEFSSLEFDIYASDGKCVQHDNLGYFVAGQNTINVNTQDLPSGNYIIKVKNNSISAVNTISIVR